MVAALLPAALFYSEYAMTDAIYPVLVLAWLLAVHSWLTAPSVRGQYAAAIGSALLAGYAYAVHSRGAVMVAGYAVTGLLIAWRRFVPRRTALAAAAALCLPLGAAYLLNRHLSSVMYPSGPRTLAGEALIRLRTVHGVIFVLADGRGPAVAVRPGRLGGGRARPGRRRVRDLPALRPGRRADHGRARGRGRAGHRGHLARRAAPDPAAGLGPALPGRPGGGVFLVGAAVLLRASRRLVLVYAACVVPPTLLAAVVVTVYAGASVPTSGFGSAFVFAEPAVLTQDWTRASVPLATAVAFVLLGAACLVAVSRFGGHWRAGVLCAGLGAVSLVASLQLTSHISQASTPAQERNTTALMTGTGLKPGQHLVIGTGLSWETWMPQAYEVWWTRLQFFTAGSQAPPADATVVEVHLRRPGSPRRPAGRRPRPDGGWYSRTGPTDGWPGAAELP